MRRGITAAALAVAAFAATAPSAFAGTPDGLGPWADSVVESDQGPTIDGSPFLPGRSDPANALGPAENTTGEGVFFALGFGGQIVLKFENEICNAEGADLGLELVEGTIEPYPEEKVDVYVSEDGVAWTLVASDVNKDAQVGLPAEVDVAHYVKVVDVTDPDDFENRPTPADGYDLDGVKSLNTNCTPPDPEPEKGKMTGGGFSWDGHSKVTHGFVLHCDVNEDPNKLLVHWKEKKLTKYVKEIKEPYKKNGKTYYKITYKTYYKWTYVNHVFYLKDMTAAECTDDPTIKPDPPAAPFDTHTGTGTGVVDHKPGYTASWVFKDAGEPGWCRDTMKIVIKDPDGNVVLDVGTTKFWGNHQAHPAHP